MYTIGPASVDDAPAMLDLQHRAFAEEGRRSETRDIPPLTELVDAVAEHILKQTALIARDDGRIIGTIRGIVNGRVCTIRALAVDPAHQGRGIGSALLNALERTLPHVAQFDLTTNTVMEGNVPFYERHGYRVAELTRHSDLVTLAQMTKAVSAALVTREFWRLMATNDFHAVAAVLAPDFVLEWPQSRERIRGAERFARMNQEYPAHGPWRFTINRLFGTEAEAVSDVTVTDGVQVAGVISFFTVDQGKVLRIVEFWPEPFAASANRAHLVEPM